MAKVVGQDEKAAKRCTCGECGAIVEYMKREVQTYSGRDMSGGPDGREWIVCPQCGEDIILRSW